MILDLRRFLHEDLNDINLPFNYHKKYLSSKTILSGEILHQCNLIIYIYGFARRHFLWRCLLVSYSMSIC